MHHEFVVSAKVAKLQTRDGQTYSPWSKTNPLSGVQSGPLDFERSKNASSMGFKSLKTFTNQ